MSPLNDKIYSKNNNTYIRLVKVKYDLLNHKFLNLLVMKCIFEKNDFVI